MRTAPLYRLKMQIRKIILDYIEKEKLTQKQAAYRLGVTQPAINDLKNQGVKNFSLDRMVTMLYRTGYKIQIKIEKINMKDSNTQRNGLFIWTIYDHPSDFPDKFVARCFHYDKPTEAFLLADTLDEIRRLIPQGLYRLDRQPNDDPVIVETWI